VAVEEDEQPITEAFLADLIATGFWIYSLAKGPQWELSSSEATLYAKPIRRVIRRVSRRFPVIERIIKVAADPAVLAAHHRGVIDRRRNPQLGNRHTHAPASGPPPGPATDPIGATPGARRRVVDVAQTNGHFDTQVPVSPNGFEMRAEQAPDVTLRRISRLKDIASASE